MSKPRVLLVMHDLTRTGAPMVAERVFRALRDDLDVRAVSRAGGPMEESFRQSFPLTVLRPGTPGAGALGRARALTYGATRRDWQPDVVYVNTVAALPTCSRLRAVQRVNAPVLLHVHEGPVYMTSVDEEYPGLIASLPDRYIALSEWVAEALREEWRIPSESISVVRSPVGDEWLASEPPERIKSDEGHFVIGGSGVPSWMKGTDLWLLTAAELINRHGGRDRYRFVWVGAKDGEATRQMTAMIERLGLVDHVDLRPHQADVRSLFAGMDLFFMSSWEEPAGLVVLEAMALAKPVACFAGSGGPPEEVGDTGIVVDRFSPVDMADAIEAIVNDPERRASLGSDARTRVRSAFGLDSIAPQILAQIEGVVDG